MEKYETSTNDPHLNLVIDERGVSKNALITGVVIGTVAFSLIPGEKSLIKSANKGFREGIVEGATSLRSWLAPSIGIAGGFLVDALTSNRSRKTETLR